MSQPIIQDDLIQKIRTLERQQDQVITTTVVGGGGSDKYYVHTQSSAAATWVVTHSLGKKPDVSVVDTLGEKVEPDVQYDSDDQVTLSFSSASTGEAYFN